MERLVSKERCRRLYSARSWSRKNSGDRLSRRAHGGQSPRPTSQNHLQTPARRVYKGLVRFCKSRKEVVPMEDEKVLVELLPKEALVEREALVPT